ncbi:MAG: D-alanyl-D-alanine carboxypeptidase family protein [Bacillota bacterium]
MHHYTAKNLALFLLMIVLITVFPAVSLGQPAEPKITAEAAVLMDMRTGQILWSKNEGNRQTPASTTKILTALLAIEKGQLTDLVTASNEATRVYGTKVYLQPEEKQTLEDLLYAMMLNSANDAAMAVAEHIGGTIEDFSRLMNEKARELGAVDSNFANPHGLTDNKHYTTARDLAIITRAAMKNATFRKIVSTKTREWRPGDPKTELVRLYNINKLLTSYSGVTGVKTGYTSEAGQCLVASASRYGQEYIAVMLGSSGSAIWNDASQLLDYAFDNYQSLELAGDKQVATRIEVDGVPLAIRTAGDFQFLMNKNSPVVPTQEIFITQLKPPVAQGQTVGELIFKIGERQIGRVNLVAGNKVDKKISLVQLWLKFTYLVSGLILFTLVVIWFRRRQRRFKFTARRGLRYERYRSYE